MGDLTPGAGVTLAVCLRTGEQIAGPLGLTWEAQSGEVVLADVRVPVWVARRAQATIGPDA